MTSRTHARGLRATLAILAPLTLTAGLLAPSADAAPAERTQRPDRTAARVAAGDRAAGVPLVFGHRGAAGYRPEHTLASYRLAVQLGADYIEPDLVSTKDGVLVARHEPYINETTDVEEHPEFADRETTKTIDGVEYTGWFVEDFTLAELKTLRATERLPDVRPENTRYDGEFTIPTFDQVLALSQRLEKRYGREIGVAPETKHPTYFESIGLPTNAPMLRDLQEAGMARPSASNRVLIQSFEIHNLRGLSRRTDLPLEQLVSKTGAPYDQVVRGTGVTYASMTKPRGLARIRSYARWVGPDKDMVLPRDENGATGEPSDLVPDAHAAGLKVVIYTLRDENQFMATNFRRGTDPNADGDVFAEIEAFLDAGVDAVFADYPDSAVYARHRWLQSQ